MPSSRKSSRSPTTPDRGCNWYWRDSLPPGYSVRNCWEDEWFVYRGTEMVTNTISRGYPDEQSAREAAWWHHGS